MSLNLRSRNLKIVFAFLNPMSRQKQIETTGKVISRASTAFLVLLLEQLLKADEQLESFDLILYLI